MSRESFTVIVAALLRDVCNFKYCSAAPLSLLKITCDFSSSVSPGKIFIRSRISTSSSSVVFNVSVDSYGVDLAASSAKNVIVYCLKVRSFDATHSSTFWAKSDMLLLAKFEDNGAMLVALQGGPVLQINSVSLQYFDASIDNQGRRVSKFRNTPNLGWVPMLKT